MEDVFEGQTVKLGFGVEKGKTDVTEVTFEVLRGGEVAITEAVKLAGKSAVLEPKTPEVKEDETSYELSYRVKVGEDEPITGEESCHVWPKAVKLKALNKEDSKAVENVCFVATQGEDRRVARSAKSGEATLSLAKPAPFDLSVKPPWRKEKSEAKKLREVEFTVFRGVEAEFCDFSPSEDPIHQLVNVTSAKDGADGKGHKVKIKVGAKGDQDPEQSIKQGQVGDKIFFQVTFGRESKRNQPLPGVIDEGDVKSLTKESEGKIQKGHVQLDAIGGTKTFEIELGYAGEDTCEVKIGGTAECGDATIKFENWRKVLYRLGYADALAPDLGKSTITSEDDEDDEGTEVVDLPNDLKDKVTKLMATVKVQVELLESVSYDLGVAAGQNAHASVPHSFLPEGTDRVKSILNGDLLKLAAVPESMRKLPTETWALQLNLCDKILKKPKSKSLTKNDLTDAEVEFKAHYALPDSAESATWTAQAVKEDHAKTLTVKWTDAGSGAESGKVVLTDSGSGLSCSLSFKKLVGHHATELTSSHKTSVKNWLKQVADAGRPDVLRQNQELTIEIKAKTGNDRRTTRIQSTKDYVAEVLRGTTVYVHPGLKDDGSPETGTIDEDDIEAVTVSKFKVKLPDLAGAASDTKCPLTVKLRWKEYKGGNGSMGGGKGLYRMRPDDPDGFVKTIAHEIGHAMGMAPLGKRVPSPGLTSKHVDNGGYYYCNKKGSTPEGQGWRDRHNGHHCAAGCADVTTANFGSQTGTCVMFGGPLKSENLNPPKFCDDCLLHAKARKLIDLRTGWTTDHRSPNDF